MLGWVGLAHGVIYDIYWLCIGYKYILVICWSYVLKFTLGKLLNIVGLGWVGARGHIYWLCFGHIYILVICWSYVLKFTLGKLLNIVGLGWVGAQGHACASEVVALTISMFGLLFPMHRRVSATT